MQYDSVILCVLTVCCSSNSHKACNIFPDFLTELSGNISVIGISLFHVHRRGTLCQLWRQDTLIDTLLN